MDSVIQDPPARPPPPDGHVDQMDATDHHEGDSLMDEAQLGFTVLVATGCIAITQLPPAVMASAGDALAHLPDHRSTPKAAVDDAFLLDNIHISNVDREDAQPSITIDQEAFDCLAKGWCNSVVIKLLGRPIAFHVLERKLKEMWKPCDGFVIVDLPHGYSIVRFDLEQDFLATLIGGPWTVFRQCIMTPSFNPARDSIKTICASVKLTNLPVILYDERVVRCIASCLGRPVRVDKNTVHATRGKFARICVELDLSVPLKRAILFNGETMTVEYEGLGEICLGCGRQGHLVNQCPLFEKELVVEEETAKERPEPQSLERI
ncbi:hypothetical protein V2J09_000984 [Rumex salicifolius]